MERVQPRYVVNLAPRTWFGRLMVTAAALAFMALALLFFSFFVILVIALIPILMIRAAWMSRFSKRKSGSEIIDVQYTVKTQDSAANYLEAEIQDDSPRGPETGDRFGNG